MSSASSEPGDKDAPEGSPLGLDAVIQRLQDTVLGPGARREDRTLTMHGDSWRTPPTSVPARIRAIVAGSLGEGPPEGAPATVHLQEENQLLRAELARLEELLAQAGAERDQLATRCHALSEGLQARLDTAQARLRTSELRHSADLEEALGRLEASEQRGSGLSQVNALLRGQLEHMRAANEALARELAGAAGSVRHLRAELERRETQRGTEPPRPREARHARPGEPQAFLRLWRQVAALRTHLAELREATDRGLADMRVDAARTAGRLHTACLHLASSLRLEARGPALAPEGQLRLQAVQGRWDAEKVALQARLSEQAQLLEKLRDEATRTEETIRALRAEAQQRESGRRGGGQEDCTEEVAALRQELSSVAQVAQEDSQGGPGGEEGQAGLGTPLGTASPQQAMFPARAHSPGAPGLALQAVRWALSRRRQQEQDLRLQLEASQVEAARLREQLSESQREGRAARRRLQEGAQEREALRDALVVQRQQAQSCRASSDLLGREKAALEAEAERLRRKAVERELEQRRLEAMNDELQRQVRLGAEQHEALAEQRAQDRRQLQSSQGRLEQLEEAVSGLEEELVSTRLQRDLAESECAGLQGSLARAESSKADLELLVSRLKSEGLGQRDTLAKVAALMEELAQDKGALNRLVQQLEQERDGLQGQQAVLERERAEAREQLSRAEQQLELAGAERRGLQKACGDLEEQRRQLEAQAAQLRRKKAELQEQVGQVTREKQALEGRLARSLQDQGAQVDALQRALQEKDALAAEQAQLLAGREALERQVQLTVEEATGLRAERDALETRLWEAQRRAEEQQERLEREAQRAREASQALQAEAAGLRRGLEQQQEDAQRERDAALALREDVARLQREKESLGLSLTEEKERAARTAASGESLKEAIESLRRERDESLRHLEDQRKQALSLKDAELGRLREEVAAAVRELEQVRREAKGQQARAEDSLTTTAMELRTLQAQFEEAIKAHQVETETLRAQLREVAAERSSTEKEAERLQAQLDEAREALARLRHELRGSRESGEVARREALEAGRARDQEARARALLRRANVELQTALRGAEQDKARRSEEQTARKVLELGEAQQAAREEAAELQAGLRQAERARRDVQQELRALLAQVKVLEGERQRQSQELRQLQARGAREAQELKRQVAKAQADREGASKEVLGLRRALTEAEAAGEAQERRLREQVRESQGAARALRAELQAVCGKLQQATGRADALQARLEQAGGRARGLQEELAEAQGARREAEEQLRRLWGTLRRGLGPHARSPSSSPERPRSPGRGVPDPRVPSRPRSPPRGPWLEPRDLGAEVDVAAARDALRDAAQRLREAQRQRDDWRFQAERLSLRLSEEESERAQAQSRVGQLQKVLVEAEEGDRHLPPQEEVDALRQALCQSGQHSQQTERRGREAEWARPARRQVAALKEQLDQEVRRRRAHTVRTSRPRSEPAAGPGRDHRPARRPRQ